MKHQVEISRDIKNSPYNVKAVIPEIECDDREQVVNLTEVQKEIDALYGRKFIVYVDTEGVPGFFGL